jgi:CRP-like cAMP-binding protein
MRSTPPGRRPWDLAARVAFLGSLRLFQPLAEDARQQVASRFAVRHLQRGEYVFMEGELAAALTILGSGRVKIVRETEEGREVILRQIEPGDIFGGAGGWGQAFYPASAVVQGDAVVLQLPATEFRQLLQHEPDFAYALISELGLRLREAEARIRDLQTEPVERRLARALLRLATKQHQTDALTVGTNVALSRQDLAELAGTTISTASRTLSLWQQQGIVASRRERVTILQPAALASLADDGAVDGQPGSHG